MALPIRPPVPPMLARLARELPVGALTYEPKWDGFRCLAFVDSGGDPAVDLRSRHDRPLARYFPEIVAALTDLRERGNTAFVIDGEIVPEVRCGPGGGFADLMSRLHPAPSRVERLSREHPTRYIAFDLLAEGAEDVRATPFVERRRRLEGLLAPAPRGGRLRATETTRDPAAASHWLAGAGSGVDGVVAKPDDLRYEPGRRSMVKVKLERTADCVAAGWRPLPDGSVSSLLLGLYADDGELRHVGVVTQLPAAERRSLALELARLAVPLHQHPWRGGFLIGASPLGRLKGSAARWTPDMEHDWVPIRPDRILEVGFDQVDGDRFRHPARLRRWRPDRAPASCRIEQIRTPDARSSGLEAAASLVAGGSGR